MSGGNDSPEILFINHWARDLGGAEYSLLDILGEMTRRNRCCLVTTEEGTLTVRARELDVECHVFKAKHSLKEVKRGNLIRTALRSWKALVDFVAYVAAVRRLVMEIRPSCIHANVPKSHATLFLLAMGGYRGQCCFHIREIFRKGSVSSILYRLLMPRKHSRIIAISEAVRENLPRTIRSLAVVIYNGVRVGPTPARRIPRNEIRFVYLGRIVPWKGCHLLIEAFRRLCRRHENRAYHLTFVGDTLYWAPDYRESLHASIVSAGLDNRCTILSHTNEPYAELARHDVFCTAAFQEPFGRSVAEAQACGLPVVAFDSGGIAEIIVHRETGLLVPYGDIDVFSEGMEHFCVHPRHVARMGECGRRRTERLFNRDLQCGKICDYILMNSSGG